MTSKQGAVHAPTRQSDGSLATGPISRRPGPHWIGAASGLLSLAGACLLLAGCGVMGETERLPTKGLRLFPTHFGRNAEEDALREAVEKDPFPNAAQVKL